MSGELTPVQAGDEEMSLERRPGKISEKATEKAPEKHKGRRDTSSSERKSEQFVSRSGVISIPAGLPPAKPNGETDEDIREWAQIVVQMGREKGVTYLPEAVAYWVRYFWDINGPDFARVRKLVLKTLNHQEETSEPDV